MRPILMFLFAITGAALTAACGGGPGSAPADRSNVTESAETRGERVVSEYVKRDSAPFRIDRARFTVKTDGSPDEVYELVISRKQAPDASTTMSEIVKSPDNANVASLAIEPKDGKATLVSYSESRDEFRETNTKRSFFGGLTAGELLGEWNKFRYKLTGERTENGVGIVEIEGKVKPDFAADTVAASLKASFRSDNFVPVEMRLFDSTGREIRIYRFANIKSDSDRPYASKIEAENKIQKTLVTIEILKREFPAKMDESVFSRERLKRPGK